MKVVTHFTHHPQDNGGRSQYYDTVRNKSGKWTTTTKKGVKNNFVAVVVASIDFVVVVAAAASMASSNNLRQQQQQQQWACFIQPVLLVCLHNVSPCALMRTPTEFASTSMADTMWISLGKRRPWMVKSSGCDAVSATTAMRPLRTIVGIWSFLFITFPLSSVAALCYVMSGPFIRLAKDHTQLKAKLELRRASLEANEDGGNSDTGTERSEQQNQQ